MSSRTKGIPLLSNMFALVCLRVESLARAASCAVINTRGMDAPPRCVALCPLPSMQSANHHNSSSSSSKCPKTQSKVDALVWKRWDRPGLQRRGALQLAVDVCVWRWNTSLSVAVSGVVRNRSSADTSTQLHPLWSQSRPELFNEAEPASLIGGDTTCHLPSSAAGATRHEIRREELRARPKRQARCCLHGLAEIWEIRSLT